MKKLSKSLIDNFENILSVVAKPCKRVENLFEIQFINQSDRKLLLKIYNPLPSLISFPQYSSYYLQSFEQFIDQSASMNVIFEYFLNDLSSEIEQRLKAHFYFEEQEIWKLLIIAIMGLSELHLKGKGYGNLDLASFVLIEEKETITFKLLHPELIFLSKTGKKDYNPTYFTIEELKALKNGKTQRVEQNMENDIFHLGLALLEMASFMSITSCYDWENLLINEKFLEKKIEIVENRYSKELAFLIKIMLNLDKNKRPTIKELCILIRKFEALEGFYKKDDIRGFVQRNLKTNVCGECIQNIRRKKEEALDKSEESGSFDEDGKKLYLENEKEWFNLQKSLMKNRSALKSIDNQNYF